MTEGPVSYAIEPDDDGRGWHVTEFNNVTLTHTVVYSGSQLECVIYVRLHEYIGPE